MRTATIAACWAVLSLGTACVQPNPSAFCDESHGCPTGQTCDVRARLCVLPAGPTINLDEPRNSQVITSRSLMLRGKIASDNLATAAYSYGMEGDWQPLSLSSEGTFHIELTLPPLDSELLPVRVRATDGVGQSTEVKVRPLVDNVAPVLTLSPADGAQRAPPAVTLISSEPLAGISTSWPVSLSPDAGVTGTWNVDRTQLWLRNLEPETAYQVSVPAETVTDFAGNRNLAGVQGTIVTAPRAPEDDLTLSFGGARVLDFEAAFDEDGVVSIAVNLDTVPQTVLWGWFSPRTGRLEVLGQALSDNLRYLRVAAARERVPGRAPERTSAVFLERVRPGTQELYQSAQWKVGTSPVQARTVDGLAVVPGPGGCAEPSPGSVGLAVLGAGGATYQRSDGSIGPRALPGGFLPRWVAYLSPDHWEWFDLSASSGAGSFRRQVWLCRCGASPSCGFLPSLDVVRASNDVDSGNAQLSMALTPLGRRLYVFNSMGGGPSRLETCYDCSAGPGSCTPGGEQAGHTLWVASMNDGGKVLGARESGGRIELVTRDLENGCSAPWTWSALGSVQDAPSVGKFRPVMFGGRPGLLYRWLPDHSLRLFIP